MIKMEAKNFTLRTKVRFVTNKGSFEYQPIMTLLDNNSMTGGKFLSLYRVVRSRNESNDINGIAYYTNGNIIDPDDVDGYLELTYADGDGLTSVTGSKEIKARSIIPPPDTDLTVNSTTGEASEYDISIISDDINDISVVVDDGSILERDILLEDIGSNINFYNYMGMGFRPEPEYELPTGELGGSLVLQYLYNSMEGTGETFATSGLTGVYDWSGNSISAAILGKGIGEMANFDVDNTVSGTVTGHTYGPIEGAFRIDGDTYIKTKTSSYFGTRHASTSGFTMMTHVKMFSSGDSDILTITDGTTVMGSIFTSEGSLVFENDNGSVSAGSITAEGQNAATADFANNRMSRWVHIAATMDASTNSTSGVRLYINGKPSVLARIQDSVSSSLTAIPEFIVNDDGYMIIARNKDEINNGLTGLIGLTRIFNRPLKEAEIFENFITSIPSQIVCNEINIA